MELWLEITTGLVAAYVVCGIMKIVFYLAFESSIRQYWRKRGHK